MNLSFRKLRADEIDLRVQSVKQNGFSLLCYKDARCDRKILDETVGPMNWEKSYQLIDGQLFCTISIWDEAKKCWVSKQDVGVESNTEAEKGRASDAQKRAAFSWGIGRELYSAPYIWISADKGTKTDKYVVTEIESEDDQITALQIRNDKTKEIVYSYGIKIREQSQPMKPVKVENNQLISADQMALLLEKMVEKKINQTTIITNYRVNKLQDLTVAQYENAMYRLDKTNV